MDATLLIDNKEIAPAFERRDSITGTVVTRAAARKAARFSR